MHKLRNPTSYSTPSNRDGGKTETKSSREND